MNIYSFYNDVPNQLGISVYTKDVCIPSVAQEVLTFCSSLNQSQHDTSIEIKKQHCDWLKDEKKDVISDVQSIVQGCDWKKADVLVLNVLLLSNPFDFNFQKWSLCIITCTHWFIQLWFVSYHYTHSLYHFINSAIVALKSDIVTFYRC